jgi:hypothetical protein
MTFDRMCRFQNQHAPIDSLPANIDDEGDEGGTRCDSRLTHGGPLRGGILLSKAAEVPDAMPAPPAVTPTLQGYRLSRWARTTYARKRLRQKD